MSREEVANIYELVNQVVLSKERTSRLILYQAQNGLIFEDLGGPPLCNEGFIKLWVATPRGVTEFLDH
jgi:hypothetical protein